MNDSEDWYPDKLTEDAISGDRKSTVKMWERIANGGAFNRDVQYWLQSIAVNLVDAESKPASLGLRDRAIVRALGLEGIPDKHRELRDLASDMKGFGYSRQVIFKTVRTGTMPPDLWSFVGYDHTKYTELDDIALLKLIDAEIAKAEKGWRPKS